MHIERTSGTGGLQSDLRRPKANREGREESGNASSGLQTMIQSCGAGLTCKFDDMATVGVGLPSLALFDRGSLVIAKESRLSAFQDCGLFFDSTRRGRSSLHICSSLQSPNRKGFGKSPTKKKAVEKKPDSVAERVPDSGNEGGLEDEAEDDVVPEVVTNRMLKRISLTVGLPLAVGVLFFPLYYYLKVVKKVDVPEWLPLLTSMVTFGTAGFGITYGVLSASWDPSREGSFLGWKEAQLNWPVFLETVQGKKGKK